MKKPSPAVFKQSLLLSAAYLPTTGMPKPESAIERIHRDRYIDAVVTKNVTQSVSAG